ncbi:MAG: hypothetical protein IMZ58_13205 [Thermoplasmata archaeon]|nr:hypothetical protein [Thermoplasmata archaeon]
MEVCSKCGKPLITPSDCYNKATKDFKGKDHQYSKDDRLCMDCWKLMGLESGDLVMIKCPYCSKEFFPRQQTPTSLTENILRGAVFLPWGVVKAVKNKPFVQCPYCKMKIQQG